jgi:outer membrane protein assembly factor BamD (BamD/ComL family)
MKKIIQLLFLFLFVSCSSTKSQKESNPIQKSEEELYESGIQQYNKQNYKNATKRKTAKKIKYWLKN